jgi:leucine dehydrogenase
MLRDHPDFDNHEQVLFVNDDECGLNAIVAIHSTVAGPALGGIRMHAYADEHAALTDVLRLSRGMTYKAAMAGLPLGGGKSVIIGDPAADKTPLLLRSFGETLNSLDGAYVGGEDMGISIADVDIIHEVSPYVVGTASGEHASGDPSPFTARGVYLGLLAAVEARLGRDNVRGLRVGVLGLGNVGMKLCQLLADAGANLIVADVDETRVAAAEANLGAKPVAPADLAKAEVDVLAPCAMGALLDPETIADLKCAVVAGAANNQLLDEWCGALLAARDILYAPDYVVNAGGLIAVGAEALGHFDKTEVDRQVARIPETLGQVFDRAKRTGRPTSEVADAIALERLSPLRQSA